MPYERDNIAALTAYTPGEQPAGGAAELVKLNTNENPYPPPAAVMEAVAKVSAEQLRRYPPPQARGFREVAAEAHGLTPDQVIATNGGDELLRMAITAFCDVHTGGVGETYPTYSLYDVLASIHDTPTARVELTDEWAIPGEPEDFADRMLAYKCRLVILVNPHAPSGRLEPLETLERIARRLQGRAVLMIDEAYVDFAERDALPLLSPDRRGPGAGGELDNVLILRTLSKGYSLAGLRFGYGLGHPRLIATLDKIRDSYNTDALAQAAATAALRSRDEAKRSCAKVVAERGRVTEALRARGFAVAPSASNFVLATPPAEAGPPAGEIYRALAARHIFVRYFDAPRLRDKLRITIGAPSQNDKLLAALDTLLQPLAAPQT